MDCADTRATTCADGKMLPGEDCLLWPHGGYAWHACAYKGRVHGRTHDCDIPEYNDKPALCATE